MKKQKKEKLNKNQNLLKNEEFSYIVNNIRSKSSKSLKPILLADEKFMTDVFKYSTRQENTFCDITGLPGRYKDPLSGTYFYNKDVYAYIKDKGLNNALRWQDLKKVCDEFYPFVN